MKYTVVNEDEYQEMLEVVKKAVDFRVAFAHNNKIEIEMGGFRWSFADKTDAQITEEAARMCEIFNLCVIDHITDKIASWVYENKRNFN